MIRPLLCALLTAHCVLFIVSCGDSGSEGVPGPGRRAAVEVLKLDGESAPPSLTYRVHSFTGTITYLKVEFTVTAGGREYKATHEPLGAEDSLAPETSKEFTLTSADLPGGTGQGAFAYAVHARILEMRMQEK